MLPLAKTILELKAFKILSLASPVFALLFQVTSQFPLMNPPETKLTSAVPPDEVSKGGVE